MISPETAGLCLELLGQVPLTVTDPEFGAKSARLIAARDDLLRVLAPEPSDAQEPADRSGRS